MPKYRIAYTVERWYEIEVEANSKQEAREMFAHNRIDYERNSPRETGSEVQENFEVHQITEEE